MAIARILGSNPGRAVTKAANDAMNAGTARALHEFLNDRYGTAQQEDDAVATATLLDTAGPYTKAHAQAAMDGPAWVRRKFVASVQHMTAQLDYDSATHIAAMHGAIAAAAKIAHKAQEDAARAQEAAARARNAAAEALQWADRAKESAAQALVSAQQANTFADDAEKSARDAQASADRAERAAAAARSAARSANYSANRAVDAAAAATASANRAQASATAAQASATQAGQDKQQAAAAASEALQIASDKRSAEAAPEAQKAAEAAAAAKKAGRNPADTAENDSVKGDLPWWKEDARWLADFTHMMSVGFAMVAAGAGIAGVAFPPAAPFLEGFAMGTALTSVAFAALSGLFAGIGYGAGSSQFRSAILHSLAPLNRAASVVAHVADAAKPLGKAVVSGVDKATRLTKAGVSGIGKKLLFHH
ncbi:ALF repeat-containing protein [Streptomyces melanogenes]|uniref:ALF repeat-containing protein n=1 Tax=Streptomyces melanogenes TaxID=67326 RepID=UPI0037A9791B